MLHHPVPVFLPEEELRNAESTTVHILALRRAIDALERSLSRKETIAGN